MASAHRCTIVPGYLLERLAAAEPGLSPHLSRAHADAARMRSRRELLGTRWPQGHPSILPPGVRFSLQAGHVPGLETAEELPPLPEVGPPGPHRSIHDARGSTGLPGLLVRAESDDPSADESVNEAYDGLGATWSLLQAAYGRDSLDDAGLPLAATVHYSQRYDNAFWDGTQMVFGDGDGSYFNSFTDSVDVIGHELTHGMTQFTAGLTYVGQSGALNEHVSDVFGSLVRQRTRGEGAGQADWLIGAGLFTDRVHGVALRSLAAPGTAYDDPVLGTDPQPARMAGYVDLPHDAGHDNGGVHINSGIPNHAFYLVATALGGNAWEQAGQVWYDVLTTPGMIPKDVDFTGFATATVDAATTRYGAGSPVEAAVRAGWRGVGVAVPAGD